MRILGYLVILTVETAEVAAHCRYGIGTAAGQKVKERFFFDGIGVFRNQEAVVEAEQFAVPVFPKPGIEILISSFSISIEICTAFFAARPVPFTITNRRISETGADTLSERRSFG